MALQQKEARYLQLLKDYDIGHQRLKKMKEEMRLLRIELEIEYQKLKPKP